MNPGPVISIESGESLAIYRRVRINETTGKVEYADAEHRDCIGFALRPTDTTVPGRTAASIQDLFAGKAYAVASEAITIGEPICAADDGKVQDCSGGQPAIGSALQAASGDGSIIRVKYYPQVPGVQATETVTATNVITAAESGKTFFLSSATEFVSTLPAPAAGLHFKFIVAAAPSGASYTVVTSGSSNIIVGAFASSADAGGSMDSEASGGDTISFVDGQAAVGDWVEVISDGTKWYATGISADEDALTITTAS